MYNISKCGITLLGFKSHTNVIYFVYNTVQFKLELYDMIKSFPFACWTEWMINSMFLRHQKHRMPKNTLGKGVFWHEFGCIQSSFHYLLFTI